MNGKRSGILILLLVALSAVAFGAPVGRWSQKQANDWYAKQEWLVGSNFVPSTAINELEMWQKDTFDLPTIDRELGWAEGIGMNTMRVFLHNIPWQEDSQAYLHRIDDFLKVADKHHIKILFVIFDSVWDPEPKAGKQREPRPHVHNSGWVQAPGAALLKDPSRWEKELKPYVVGVIGHFHDDDRVLMWDLMNEPDNENGSYKATELPNKAEMAQKLLEKEWEWARSVKPMQPLTSGVWRGNWSSDGKLSKMERLQLDNSDVITYHSYDPPDVMQERINSLKRFGRPILCTEYMARPRGSTFEAILPLLKKENVAAYNWGFVSGKSQTIYPWDSWTKTYTAEPPLWFHDIFRKDGTPYREDEVALIRKLTGRGSARK